MNYDNSYHGRLSHVTGGLLGVIELPGMGKDLRVTMGADMVLSKIEFQDVVLNATSKEAAADMFDGTVAIMTAELQKLIPDLIQALDGEAEKQP